MAVKRDDTIAQIVYDTQEFGNHENVMIISSDKDFVQLHQFNKRKAILTQHQKIGRSRSRIRVFEKPIFCLDAKVMGVPNVLSDDKVLAEGRRQNTLSAKKRQALIEGSRSFGSRGL